MCLVFSEIKQDLKIFKVNVIFLILVKFNVKNYVGIPIIVLRGLEAVIFCICLTHVGHIEI